MLTFHHFIPEASDDIVYGARSGSFETITIVVKCPRGHSKTFDSPKDMSHNRYSGNFVMWECSKCPESNRHFNVQIK